MGVTALYRLGIIQRLPDPPLPGFDANKVHGSGEAYGQLATPDAVLGLVSYAITLVLTTAGGENRLQTVPWLPTALGGCSLTGSDAPAQRSHSGALLP